MNIRDRIKLDSKNYSLYNIRVDKYRNSGNDIPFRVSPKPFKLTAKQTRELNEIGHLVCAYMDAVIELYNNNEDVRKILDKGKPDIYLKGQMPRYLFLRPDLMLTNNGFSICEIETSPFGLALAEILNRAYGNKNFNTIVDENKLKSYISSEVSQDGIIAYSDKTKAFGGQMQYLADQIFSDGKKKWISKIVDGEDIASKEIYRAFYLSEYLNDKNIARILQIDNMHTPTLTPQVEEKAVLSFIWDKRFVEFFRGRVGQADFEHLRTIIPPTWILGGEGNFDLGMPNGASNSLDIADLEKSKRKYVLKQSGFSSGSSWAEGVSFLHKLSKKSVREKLEAAIKDDTHLYVLQEFREGKHQMMEYVEANDEISKIKAKIRITPYYSFSGKHKGELIAAKVTGCENTEYIHASTESINTAVEKEGGFER